MEEGRQALEVLCDSGAVSLPDCGHSAAVSAGLADGAAGAPDGPGGGTPGPHLQDRLRGECSNEAPFPSSHVCLGAILLPLPVRSSAFNCLL